MEYTKVCTKCKVELPTEQFYIRYRRGSAAYLPSCKDCCRKARNNLELFDRLEDESSVKCCTECGEAKPLSEYNFAKRGGYYYGKCKICHKKANDRIRLKNLYGVDEDWRKETLMAQDGKCAICRIPFNTSNFRPYIDHNAVNGQVRGLLCNICNVMLGVHKENCETLRAAGFDRHAEYLERFKKMHEIKLVG